MPIEGTCPSCGAMVVFPDHAVGRNAKCSTCLDVFKVSQGSCAPPKANIAESPLGRRMVMALTMTVVICAVLAVPLVGLILQPGASAHPRAAQASPAPITLSAVLPAGPADTDADGVIDARQCRADYDGNNRVEVADLVWLLRSLGGERTPHADLTSDGQVDAADLNVLLGSWGPCQ